MHIRKEVPPAASPSTLEDFEGGNQYTVHGFSRCACCMLCEGKVVCNFHELGQFGSPISNVVSKGFARGLFGGNMV